MKSICIVSHNAYGAMTGGQTGHIGGVERQTSLMARWFAHRGYDVSVLTWDEGRMTDDKFDGVQIIPMCKQNSGISGIRFIHPRWTSLNRAMRRAKADLYYQNCAEYFTGIVSLWCRRHHRPFVYSVASDPDCDPRLTEMTTLREKILYKFGLTHADHVIVQTNKQKTMLQNGFGIDSTLLPMPCPGPGTKDYQQKTLPKVDPPRVAWIGRISKVKRPGVLLDVAATLPNVLFDLVGVPDNDDAFSKDIFSRARAMPNVKIHGRVPIDRMPDIYKKVSLLCCTSSYEGFPNTFLEAWSYGIPVVSTVDPDQLIMKRSLGISANDIPSMKENINTLLNSPDYYLKISNNSRHYYFDNHSFDFATGRFENFFLDVFDSYFN